MTNKQLQTRLAAKGEFTLLMWNHTNRSTKSGSFAFAPSQEVAERMAREYVAYLPENQVQVSRTGVYPIDIVLRLWNHKGEIKQS